MTWTSINWNAGYLLGVNRLSIGVQSFDDQILRSLNRAHNSAQSTQCIQDAKEIGFNNISMDLIYGIPGLTMELWQEQVDTFLEFDLPHLSAYQLTVEPKTPLHKMVENQHVQLPADSETSRQMTVLVQKMKEAGFRHYEISNFARDGWLSKHNTAYWKGTAYLGIGPSAHSYLRIKTFLELGQSDQL